MLFTLLLDHLWLTIALWAAIYGADYYLTLVGARLYASGVQRVLVIEGSYELNPLFQNDIDQRRRISRRFILMLGATSLLIAFVWRGVQLRWFPPGIFQFWMGALLLIELVVLMRHLRNIAMFRAILCAADITGQLTYPRWLTLSNSATDLGLFAVAYLLLAGVAAPWFFLGGALACASTALRHRRYASQASRRPRAA